MNKHTAAPGFQIQLRWATHSKGPEFWQTQTGLFATIESAQLALADAMSATHITFTHGRVIVNGTARRGQTPVVVA